MDLVTVSASFKLQLVTVSASFQLQFINQFQIMVVQYDYTELSTTKSKKYIMKNDSAHNTTNQFNFNIGNK